MEGAIARWYARNTRGDAREYRKIARAVADRLPAGAHVLELAPGPGYLAIELAKLGLRVTGLDISRTFVHMAAENARVRSTRAFPTSRTPAGMPPGPTKN